MILVSIPHPLFAINTFSLERQVLHRFYSQVAKGKGPTRDGPHSSIPLWYEKAPYTFCLYGMKKHMVFEQIYNGQNYEEYIILV